MGFFARDKFPEAGTGILSDAFGYDPRSVATDKSKRQDVALAGATILAFIYGGPQAAAAIASLGLGAAAQTQATGAAEVELELAARQEKLGAIDREEKRKSRLVAVLGAQSAAAAAAGVSNSGSVANVSLTDAERAQTDRLVDRANTRVTLTTIGRRRSSIRRAGALRTGSSVLSTGSQLFQGVKIDPGGN